MTEFLLDLRLALRRMRREPGFTLVVVATLALAMGATTAVLSAVYRVMVRPLPYPASEQLVRLYQSTPQRERIGVSYGALQAWRERTHAFQALEGLSKQDMTLTGEEGAEWVMVGRATDGLLPLLGAWPHLGRPFAPDAENSGRARDVLISASLWQRRFGGRPDVVGQVLTLDGAPHTVLGVLPATFRFAPEVDLWMPLVPRVAEGEAPEAIFLRAVARLRPGVSVVSARAELTPVAAALAREPAHAREPAGVRVVPLQAQLAEDSQEPLTLLAGVGALVLLVACANIANLLLARATTREREVAVRAALGAGRARLIQQFLIESAVLALTGGAVGLLLAVWGIQLLRTLIPAELLPADELGLEPHVVAIAAGLSLLTSVLFGLVPALRAARSEARGVLGGLRGGAHGATRRSGARALLVVGQVALALVPLVGAGLMLRTLYAMQGIPLGFSPREAWVADVDLPVAAYPDDASKHRVLEALVERVRALPGVEAAGLASTVPRWARDGLVPVVLPGEPATVAEAREPIHFRTVGGDSFSALGFVLKEGRRLDASDRAGTAPVMVVSEAFARRYFPGRSVVGQHARLAFDDEPLREVVGVVGDVRHGGPWEAPSMEVYLPLGQFSALRMLLTVRVRGEASWLGPALREQLRAVDPRVPLVSLRSMDDVVDASLGGTRVLASLLAALAVLGLGIAGVGIYGVLSYAVSLRTRELGIRSALGASREHLVWLVVGQGLRLTGLGVALGLVGAAVLARSLAGMVHGVAPLDPVTFVAVPGVLATVALLASWLPTRRALRVSPGEALRRDG
ncbi:permease [Corallococcus sp. H22C18031201]|nr:permease [Corallococcus sp. H22C18031201]